MRDGLVLALHLNNLVVLLVRCVYPCIHLDKGLVPDSTPLNAISSRFLK